MYLSRLSADVLQPERADPHPLADHGRRDPRARAHPGRGRRPARRLLHPGDPLPPGPLPRGTDLAVRRPAGVLREQRQVHRPLRRGAQELRHALHRALQVSET